MSENHPRGASYHNPPKSPTLIDSPVLSLSNTQVTDVGLRHLTRLTNLEELYIANTQISDTGLEHLKGLTNLGLLDLYGTQVTDEGVQKFKQVLPNCEVHR